MMSRLIRAFSLLFCLSAIIAIQLHAQVQTGTPPFASFSGGPEVINLGNLNAHLVIPVIHKPGRGTPFTYDLSYDSSIWYPVGSSGNQYWQPAGLQIWGWAGQTEVAVGYISANQTVDSECGFWKYLGGGQRIFIVEGYVYDLTNWVYHDQFRGSHPFVGSTIEYTGSCTGQNTSFTNTATDGSGYTLNANGGSGTVTYRKGDVAQPNTNVGNGAATYRDTNGNLITVDGSGHFYDTLSGTTPVLTLSGSGTPTSPNVFNYNLPSGSNASYTMNFVAYTVATNFGFSTIHEYGATVVNLVDNIQLPDNSTYKFSYEQTPSTPSSGACSPKTGTFQSYCVTGRLASITLPTGGKITYTYSGGNNGVFSDGSVATLTRTVTDGGSWSGTWTYARSQVSGSHWQTTVTTPTNDTTVVDFQEDSGSQNFYETQRQVYQGSTAGTLFQTLTTCYNGNTANCPTTAIALPITQKNITNQLGSGAPQALQVTKYNNYGLPTEEDDYDYSTGTPSTVLRKTVTSYASLGNGIVSLPSQTSICNPTTGTSGNCNGTGTPVAQTLYYYDESTPVAAPSGTPQLNSISGARGNVTRIQRCTGVSTSSPCTTNYIQNTMTYDTAGQLQKVTDGNGNPTNFSYADSFFTDNGSNPASSYPSSVPTDAYLTKVTLPTSNTLTFGYYYYSGQLAVSTDQNGISNYSHFQDPMSRLTSAYGPTVPLPAGGSAAPWVLNTYSSSDTQVDAYVGILDSTPSTSCSICRHDQTLFDGLGRAVHGYLMNDPEGKTAADTVYDLNGRVQSASHSYRNTTDSTYGLERPTYDVLGRTTNLTHPDGTLSQTFYGSSVGSNGGTNTQNCPSGTYGTGFPVLSVDESRRKHEVWIDAVGRIIEGDEPDSSGNLTSFTCYSRDYLGNVLQIVHGSQTRTFAYDPLSRLTSATIPELASSSGQNCSITYTYDNNSNIQTRTAPASNQTSCVVTTNSTTYVTTTYSYDTANRLTKISYSDGTTPTVQYGYDGAALSGCTTAPPSLTDPNPKGRRTSMCDGSGATSWAHDAAGRVSTESRMIAGINKTISYTYNLDSTIGTVTYPSGKTVTYTTSNAERLTSAKDTSSSTQFAMVASYAPTGALQGMITGQVSGGFAGVTESHTYNNSLEYTSTQATSTVGTALNLALNYNLSGGDSGTVTSITNNVDNGRTLTFGYDPLNRISSTSSQATSGADCWGQTFAPDSLGNLDSITSSKCNSTMLNLGVDANNHINNSGFGYDAAGDMTQDGTSGVTYYFDAENRMYKITGISGGPYCYFYDGNGTSCQEVRRQQ